MTKADRQMVRMADIPAWRAVEANDMVRIDHFRVLDTYFSISYGDMNAKRGGAVGFSWAVMTTADTWFFTMQDLLGMSSEARMHRSSNRWGNWRWRMRAGCANDGLAEDLRACTENY